MQELNISLSEDSNFDISLSEDSNLDIELQTAPITPAEKDYNNLYNKPSINNVELIGDRDLDELNIQVKGDYPNSALTNREIEDLLNSFN